MAILRKAILKQKEWKIKQGNSLKAGRLKKVEKEIKKHLDGFFKGLDDESGERIIKAANRFLELAEEHCIIAKSD